MGDINLSQDRIGTTKVNNKNEVMMVVEYVNTHDITVEFQDEYKARVHTSWGMFERGVVKNPYRPMVFGAGIIGNKYKSRIRNKLTIEYRTWQNMLQRCFSQKYKNSHPAYQDVTCCNEWLLFENFYEWMHSQENFDKWASIGGGAIDKDILIKGNRIYSPDACCLVPQQINSLFIKRKDYRGDCPIGVSKLKKYYVVDCHGDYVGLHSTLEDAFLAYKEYKEKIIKQIAQREYDKGNITKECYEAMLKYEVEITD